MSEKGKGVVQVVLEKKKKDNVTPFWIIVVNDVEYSDYKGTFKDKKGEEIEFEWSESDDKKIKFINPVGGGGFKGGGGSRGKSPEEIALQRKSFALSYAKDQIEALLHNTQHMLVLPEGMKYLEFFEFFRDALEKSTIKTAKEFLKVLE